jgi:ATP-binding cassette subfamily B protein
MESSAKVPLFMIILNFNKQYETVLGERDFTLSVKTKRFHCQEPLLRILYFTFDDCLSAVDTETEEAMNNLHRNL